MITYKRWIRQEGSREWQLDGWFLFGFIPLVIRDQQVRGRFGKK